MVKAREASGKRARALTSGKAARAEGTGAEAAVAPPAIILVNPQLGENIGFAARAMANFGLTDLRLVGPRDGWPNDKAHAAAAGAAFVVEQASVYRQRRERDRRAAITCWPRPRGRARW